MIMNLSMGILDGLYRLTDRERTKDRVCLKSTWSYVKLHQRLVKSTDKVNPYFTPIFTSSIIITSFTFFGVKATEKGAVE